MQVGDTNSFERTFTVEDVQQFARISGDQGIHHMVPDDQGRLMVHGLLTATLPTKLGGDMNYIARELTFEFVRPVYTGDTVRCNVIITQLEQREGRIHMWASWICRNQKGKEVLKGHTSGIIREAVNNAITA